MLMRPNLVPRAFSLGKRPWERGWMRPSKAETAVHGCHCPGDMAVRMRKVLARPWVCVRVCHLLSVLLHKFTSHTDRQLRLIHLPSACRGRTAVRFPATSSHMCCVKLALKGVLCTCFSSKGRLRRAYGPNSARRLCHADEASQGRNSCAWLPLLG